MKPIADLHFSQSVFGKIALSLFIVLMAGWLTGANTPAVQAHEIQPAIVDLSFEENNGFTLEILLNLEAVIVGIEPEIQDTAHSENAPEYDRLRALSAEELEQEFAGFRSDFLAGLRLRADGAPLAAEIMQIDIPPVGDLALARESLITLTGKLPEGTQTLTWGWAPRFGSSVIRIQAETREETYSAYLAEGQDSDPLPVSGPRQRSTADTVMNYIFIGYTHILPKGMDHILFVVGLFLLSARLHPLLWQITAFTAAHTITLALGITGMVTISASIVEPLIALSIVYVSVENILTQKLTRWRPVIVFLFGLLHGLGFAGVLQEIGLPADQFAVGLISFNVGVELGQLSVIALCFLAVGFWFSSKPWYRTYIVIPASLTIGIIAGWWFIERTFLA